MIADTLDRLLEGSALSEDEAYAMMDTLLQGELGPERIAALIVALRAKGPAVAELVGFARAMREHSHHITPHRGPVVDNCGTGGARHKAFNISTTAAFVLAGAGLTVAKHGNRSVTRPSGSADILEAGGARLDLSPDEVDRVLAKAGIAFLYAPAFHPAMRHAGPVRQSLGIKTVFNLLGPLTNPAGATHQVLGVYDPDLVPLMANVLARLGGNGFVLHGLPGFDEATPCGPVSYVAVRNGRAGPVEKVTATDVGLQPCKPGDIAVAPPGQALAQMLAILDGTEQGPRADTVAFNAAFGLVATDRAADLAEGVRLAQEVLRDGRGKEKWDAFLAAQENA